MPGSLLILLDLQHFLSIRFGYAADPSAPLRIVSSVSPFG